jgi:hypothetical protein
MDAVVTCGTCGKEHGWAGPAAWCCPKLLGVENGVATYIADVVLKQPPEYVEIKISIGDKLSPADTERKK